MSGTGTAFRCLRCGRCCTNLLAEDMGVLRGLTLLPEERGLFPGSVVRPVIGLGRRPHGIGFRIIAYQLTKDTCPHLEENTCLIYPKRPASCRQFPFSLRRGPDGGRQIGLDLNCPSLLSLLEGNPRLRLSFDEGPEAERLLAVEGEALDQPRRAWFYDLGARKWINYSVLLGRKNPGEAPEAKEPPKR